MARLIHFPLGNRAYPSSSDFSPSDVFDDEENDNFVKKHKPPRIVKAMFVSLNHMDPESECLATSETNPEVMFLTQENDEFINKNPTIVTLEERFGNLDNLFTRDNERSSVDKVNITDTQLEPVDFDEILPKVAGMAPKGRDVVKKALRK